MRQNLKTFVEFRGRPNGNLPNSYTCKNIIKKNAMVSLRQEEIEEMEKHGYGSIGNRTSFTTGRLKTPSWVRTETGRKRVRRNRGERRLCAPDAIPLVAEKELLQLPDR